LVLHIRLFKSKRTFKAHRLAYIANNYMAVPIPAAVQGDDISYLRFLYKVYGKLFKLTFKKLHGKHVAGHVSVYRIVHVTVAVKVGLNHPALSQPFHIFNRAKLIRLPNRQLYILVILYFVWKR